MKRIGNLFNRIISYEKSGPGRKKARLGVKLKDTARNLTGNPYEKSVRLQKGINRRYLSLRNTAYIQSSPIVVNKERGNI